MFLHFCLWQILDFIQTVFSWPSLEGEYHVNELEVGFKIMLEKHFAQIHKDKIVDLVVLLIP